MSSFKRHISNGHRPLSPTTTNLPVSVLQFSVKKPKVETIKKFTFIFAGPGCLILPKRGPNAKTLMRGVYEMQLVEFKKNNNDGVEDNDDNDNDGNNDVGEVMILFSQKRTIEQKACIFLFLFPFFSFFFLLFDVDKMQL